MAQPSTQDLVHGIDFTGINPATGADHNTLIDQGFFGPDVGGILTTTDSALDTPIVPNATIVTKWTRYLWKRIPYTSDPVQDIRCYAWNDNLSSNVTFLKWEVIVVDLTAIEAAVTVAETAAANAQTTAAAASASATAANTLATQTAAQVQTAITDSASAKATATQASSDVAGLQSTVTTLTAEVNTLSGTVAGKKAPNDALIPGSADQNIRTNLAGTGVEWYNRVDNYALITEEATSATGSNGANVRQLNTVRSNTGGFVSGVAGGLVGVVYAGIYLIKGFAVSRQVTESQLTIQQNGSDVGFGISLETQGGFSSVSSAVMVVTASAGDTFNLAHYITIGGSQPVLGKAMTAHNPATAVLSYMEIYKIG